jgi:uncharacterized SAM-binding protein YcdF (DUF218 family)
MKIPVTGGAARLRAVARAFGAAAVAAYLLCAFTPLAGVAYRAVSTPAELRPADAIVVLGAGVTPDGMLSGNSLRRTVYGVRLFRDGMAPRVVMLGAAHEGVVEAEVRARLAVGLGVPAESIDVEPGGHTTRAEAALVARRLGRTPPPTILLVTNVQHMPRARLLFERAGMIVAPAPVPEDSSRLERPQHRVSLALSLAQELVARAYNRLAGGL